MTANGPLTGVRVVELAHIMAGPVCGRMLADLGAEVIKVERPGGEDSRRMAPPWIGEESASFLMVNHNKRGMVIDLKSEDGRDVFRRLATSADVLIENFRMGALDKLGLGYDVLSALNPRLVWCEISGFGRTGPFAGRGGFDLVAQGMSGLMSVTGEGPGRPPVKVGAPVADISAGVLGALGVVAALHARAATGRGQRVDTSLMDAAVMLTFWQSAMTLATGRSPGPMGTAHPLDAPYQAFEALDGWLNVGAANQSNWERLLVVIGRPELDADPRFSDNPARMQNLSALVATLQPVFRTRTVTSWLAALDDAGVPAGPILSIAEMLEHPQVRARDMVVTTQHEHLGEVASLGLPIKLSQTPGQIRRGAPTLGQHSRDILHELGYAEKDAGRLLASGAVQEG